MYVDAMLSDNSKNESKITIEYIYLDCEQSTDKRCEKNRCD